MIDAPFTYVERKKKKKKKIKDNRNGRQGATTSAGESLESLLLKSTTTLASSAWNEIFLDCLGAFTDGFSELSSPSRALCLGLGSPMSSATARAQLDTLITLCTHYSLGHQHVAIYDPAFSREDREGLSALGFDVQSTNKSGKYDLATPALLYMPHCGLKLQENFFRHNWARGKLEKLLMITNDLALYTDSIATHKLRMTYPCTSRLLLHIVSRRLPKCPPLPEAFNDMSLQYITPGTLPPEDDSAFWELEPEPLPAPSPPTSPEVVLSPSSSPSGGVVDADAEVDDRDSPLT